MPKHRKPEADGGSGTGETMKTDIAIIGAGLSGLFLARLLHEAGCDFQVFEGRKRFGGRIKTHDFQGTAYDLGPSWYWPGQRRMETLVSHLGLSAFDQDATGEQLFETETGQIIRDRGFASMEGSQRVDGGMARLIEGLLKDLPKERLHTNHLALSIKQNHHITFGNGVTAEARHVVLALPPRLISTISIEPQLSKQQLDALRAIPTWMAGHAKFVALYETPFWRATGLSGDASSHVGPLVEIHDASPSSGNAFGALFGFVGVPVSHRQNRDDLLVQSALEQLGRLFGSKALKPKDVIYKDWAVDPQTAMPLDHQPLTRHPTYGTPTILKDLPDRDLYLCATEVAPEMGGFLEGALSAAETTAALLMKDDALCQPKTPSHT